MSLKATQIVWEHAEATGGARLVLLAIADRADDDGRAWPSIDDIAERVKIDRRNVRRHIAKLEEAGELTVTRRAGGSSTYTITVETRGAGAPPQPEPGAQEPGAHAPPPTRGAGAPTPGRRRPTPGAQAPPEQSITVKNPKTKNPPTPHGGSARGFDSNPCPKVGKTERVAALAAINAWSEDWRRTPLLRHRDEERKFWEALDEIAGFPAIPTPNGMIPAPSLVPLAIAAKRADGVRFKNLAFAMGCVRSQLQEWESGAPEGVSDERQQRVSANGRGPAAGAGHHARRQAQASREFAESPDKPSVPVWSPNED